ncbi:hypothetical protein [Nocardioides sp. Leaf374]|uniref:hypothetical protein n=1 Tax=Nocardioides sp. Leaf374 TaxID=2876560 RepID=UPI001E544850|nr:hypothetical protein [Nocardioides sp. Leaf374]
MSTSRRKTAPGWLRRLVATARTIATRRTEVSWFYNLDNHRADDQVARELRAIASTRPATIDLVECVGNRLPDLPGYRLLRNTGGKRRRERANVAAYVRDDLPAAGPSWIDLHRTWPRTHGPGTHEARSFMLYRLGRIGRLVWHQPPRNARGWEGLQQEGLDAVAEVMRPRVEGGRARRALSRLRPRMATGDTNSVTGDAGPNPDVLARRIGGKVHNGHRIDNVVVRGAIKVLDTDVVHTVAGVRLRSDHKHALRIRWRVRAIWLTTSSKEHR